MTDFFPLNNMKKISWEVEIMLNRSAKKNFDELKRRVQEQRQKNPPAKTEADVSVENRDAEQLMPYIYDRIKEVS